VRRVLLAGMNYRGYDERICRDLETFGKACVQLPFKGKAPNAGYNVPLLGRLTHRLSSVQRREQCEQFVKGDIACALAGGGFDAVLLINPVFLLDRSWIGAQWPPIYAWLMDPVWRYRQFRETIAVAKRTFSYDSLDCASFGLTELPLFSLTSRHSVPFNERETDFCFIGSLYLERAEALNRIIEFCERNGKSYRFVGDFHAFTRLARPLMQRRYPKLFSSFEVTRLTPEECLDSYARSRCVVNFHASGHKGFSMRTFEALSCGANILTELAPSGTLDAHFGSRIIVAESNRTLSDSLLARCLVQPGKAPSPEAVNDLSLRARLAALLTAVGDTVHV